MNRFRAGIVCSFGLILGCSNESDTIQAPSQESTSAGVGQFGPPGAPIEIQIVDPSTIEQAQQVANRLKTLSGCKSAQTSVSNRRAKIVLLNAGDVADLAKLVDFGDVVEADADQRKIQIHVVQEKLDSVEKKVESKIKFAFDSTTPSERILNPDTSAKLESELTEMTIAGIVLEPKSVLDSKVHLLIPRDFCIMDEEMLAAKYPAAQRPTLVYSNETGAVSIAINHTKNPMRPNELPGFRPQIASTFRQIHPMATWFKNEMIRRGERDWILLELRTPAIDAVIRNMIAATSFENRLLIVAFSATQELETDWLNPAAAILESIRIAR